MTETAQSPELVQITLTAEELSTKQISSYNLQIALEGLHRDGICVISNGVDPAHCDKLNSRMVEEAKILYGRPQTARNFDVYGNIQQEPVNDCEYIFEDIIVNHWVTSITECMLGPNPHMRFYSSNTAFKSTHRQPVQSDVGDFEHLQMQFAYAVNVNLVSTSPQNGATGIWLGSHRDTNSSMTDPKDDGVLKHLVEDRRKFSPPLQPPVPKGAIIIRDFWIWYAGMPNHTDDPRVMLISTHFAAWYRSDLKFFLPNSLKGKINWGRLVPCVNWVDDDYDYLQGRHDHDFSQRP